MVCVLHVDDFIDFLLTQLALNLTFTLTHFVTEFLINCCILLNQCSLNRLQPNIRSWSENIILTKLKGLKRVLVRGYMYTVFQGKFMAIIWFPCPELWSHITLYTSTLFCVAMFKKMMFGHYSFMAFHMEGPPKHALGNHYKVSFDQCRSSKVDSSHGYSLQSHESKNSNLVAIV